MAATSSDEGWPELGVLAGKRSSKSMSVHQSRCGGGFTLLPSSRGPASARSGPVCSVCSSEMAMIFYVHAPLPGFVEERALHVFACLNAKTEPRCSGEWRVLRQQYAAVEPDAGGETVDAPADSDTVGDGDSSSWDIGGWDIGGGGDDEDWTKDAPADSEWDDLLQQADSMAVQGKQQQGGKKAAATRKKGTAKKATFAVDSTQLPAQPVDWQSEPDGRDTAGIDDAHIERLLARYRKEEQAEEGEEQSGGAASAADDAFEDLTSRSKAIHRFTERVNRLPSQCLRYCFGGVPLLYTGELADVQPPPCPNCQAPRIFELQAMPALIEHVKQLDFGTVLFFTCSASCHGDAADGMTLLPECAVHQAAL